MLSSNFSLINLSTVMALGYADTSSHSECVTLLSLNLSLHANLSAQDVITLTLTPNPTPADPNAEKQQAAYICPLTLKEMTGALPFVYLATCGCVFSAAGLRALSSPAEMASPSTPPSDSKDAPSSSKQTLLCPQCSKPYDRLADIRTLNPGPEEEAIMREAMEARRAAKKASTKGKKRKAAEMQNGEADGVADVAEHKKPKTVMASTAPRTNASIATVTRRVTESLVEEESKRKGKMSDAIASLYGPKDGSKKKKETFMTMGTFTRVSFSLVSRLFVIDTLPVCIMYFWIPSLCLPMRLHNAPSFLKVSATSCIVRLWLNPRFYSVHVVDSHGFLLGFAAGALGGMSCSSFNHYSPKVSRGLHSEHRG